MKSVPKIREFPHIVLVLMVSGFLSAACGALCKIDQSRVRITGFSANGGWPAVVSLQDDRGRHFCTAFFIRQTRLLTAAHCFDKVRQISAVLDSGLQIKIRPGNIVKHLRYVPYKIDAAKKYYKYDIAVVTLERRDLPRRFQISTLDINRIPYWHIAYGFTIVGFGRHVYDKVEASAVKRYGNNSSEVSEVMYDTEHKIITFDGELHPDSKLGNESANPGDSGGPALCRNNQTACGLIIHGFKVAGKQQYTNRLLDLSASHVHKFLHDNGH